MQVNHLVNLLAGVTMIPMTITVGAGLNGPNIVAAARQRSSPFELWLQAAPSAAVSQLISFRAISVLPTSEFRNRWAAPMAFLEAWGENLCRGGRSGRTAFRTLWYL